MKLKGERGRGFAHDGGGDALRDDRVTGKGCAQEEEEDFMKERVTGTMR